MKISNKKIYSSGTFGKKCLIYNFKKCGIFYHTMRHFNASQIYVIKDHSNDLKF